MKGSSFEDLEVWKKACRLSVDIYKVLSNSRDYGMKDQMCRSSISVASNIAEGSERHSHLDFIRFLRIAMGSAAELRTQVYIASEIELIPREASKEFIRRTKSISQMLQALISSLEKKRSTGNGKR